MNLLVTAHSGFCSGVELAVRDAFRAAQSGKRLYMLGEVVHNPTVIAQLEALGAKIIDNPNEITDPENAVALIRAHGVPPETEAALDKTGAQVIDKTCPRVKKVQRLAREAANRGRSVIILGNPEHPEVTGIAGYCRGTRVEIIADPEALAAKLSDTAFIRQGVTVVTQTTYSLEKLARAESICARATSAGADVEFCDTVCRATYERQREAAELAGKADLTVVVGGAHSSNTLKLYQTASEKCDTVLTESARDFDTSVLKGRKTVALIGGSSTPGEEIEKLAAIISGYTS